MPKENTESSSAQAKPKEKAFLLTPLFIVFRGVRESSISEAFFAKAKTKFIFLKSLQGFTISKRKAIPMAAEKR